jgi:hypothetical protein
MIGEPYSGQRERANGVNLTLDKTGFSMKASRIALATRHRSTRGV